jgi:Beta-lactamase
MILLRPLSISPALVGTAAAALPDALPRPVATGHAVTAGRIVAVQQGRTAADAPAGALAVSAADLVALGLLHIGKGEPHLLPPEVAALMREPVPGALPFGLADGWGLGLAVWDGPAGSTWTGHDGNGDGTACYLRISPADRCVIAMTANAGTGGALWHDLLGELASRGIPVARPAQPGLAAAAPAIVPAGCAGQYANGELEFTVTEAAGAVYLTVDGDSEAALTFHENLAFSVIDPVTWRRVFGGRFVPDPVTGEITGMQVGGRFARQLEPARAGGAWSARGASALF